MAEGVQNLETYAIIGFDGSAIKSLKAHPGGEHIIYPMGNKVCIQEWKSKKMYFLSGHSNTVSTVAVSKKGKYVGSGQINHIGFRAMTKVWDFATKKCIGTHELHKVRVECIAFTSDERYLISLGGRDDGSIVMWDCVNAFATGTATASRLTTGDANTLSPLNARHNSFVSGGDSNLRVWNIRAATKNLDAVDVGMGKLRRSVRCIAISKDDKYGVAGTSTGDILKFSVKYPVDPLTPVDGIKPSLIGCFAKCGLWKKNQRPEVACYSLGVECVMILDDGCLLVGAGDGTIEVLDEINWKGTFPKTKVAEPCIPYFKALRSCKLSGCVTSLEVMESGSQRGKHRLILAGTRLSEIYAIDVVTFVPTIIVTCHRCAINDIAFPLGMSGVFATGGAGDVRVWCLETAQELLRICVPNFTCSALLFNADGKAIITAWNDGNIRAFTPLTGKLIYCIFNTHSKGTSALGVTRDGRTLVSGGCEGQVRVWDILPSKQSLKKVLKEHKSPVSAIQVSPNSREAVSAGTDGSCIIWDLGSLSRRQVMYANTLFMCVCYEPTGCQLLTGGTDRRVSYWETGSGNLARELEASKLGAINGVHVSEDGALFVTGGNDQMVKLWQYQEGIYTHTGLGHAGAVTSCRFSPDGRYIVSSCAAGTLIIWKVPEIYQPAAKSPSAQATGPSIHKRKNPEPKTLEEELRLPLEEKKAGGDRPRARAPRTKEEKITSMDTNRDSVHSCCPCGPVSSGRSASQPPPVARDTNLNLPTKTTSKKYVNGSGGGDKK